MFQEFKDFITITLAKRLTSPFLASFIFAWCITNYDITLLIFSTIEWNSKISIIDNTFEGRFYTDTRFLYPLAISLFYVIAWPIFDMLFFAISRYWTNLYKSLQLRIEKQVVISLDEKREMFEKFDESIATFRQEISDKNARINELESREKDASTERAKLINQLKENKEFEPKFNEYGQLSVASDEVNPTHETKPSRDVGSGEFHRSPLLGPDRSKEYTLKFHLSRSVRKSESLLGRSYPDKLFVSFNKSDVSELMFKAIHDINYSEANSKIANNTYMLINQITPDGIYAEWVLNKSPYGLQSKDIIDIWHNDYLENTKEGPTVNIDSAESTEHFLSRPIREMANYKITGD